jgi:hypothetical protein
MSPLGSDRVASARRVNWPLLAIVKPVMLGVPPPFRT